MEHISSWSKLGEDLSTKKKNIQVLLQTSREVGLEVNIKKTKYMVVSPPICRIKSQFTDS
jgi:hypothetical protein